MVCLCLPAWRSVKPFALVWPSWCRDSSGVWAPCSTSRTGQSLCCFHEGYPAPFIYSFTVLQIGPFFPAEIFFYLIMALTFFYPTLTDSHPDHSIKNPLCSSDRFGSGFTVKMYLVGASCDVDIITNFMQEHFPSTYLKVKKWNNNT